MANKKAKKKAAKQNKTTSKKSKPVKKTAKKIAPKKVAKKAPAKKKAVLKKAPIKSKSVGERSAAAKAIRVVKKPVASSRSQDPEPFEVQASRTRSAGQSGDLQGLSNSERANSESVDELIEEGNPFEADVVAGVEAAGDHEEEEVHTHEVPEDDVPSEYLDEE
jgi:hypothetical protein